MKNLDQTGEVKIVIDGGTLTVDAEGTDLMPMVLSRLTAEQSLSMAQQAAPTLLTMMTMEN